MEDYTVQYSASVRGCSDVPPAERVPMTISGTLRRFEITNLEEDSEVSGNITAINIRGRMLASFTTSTLTTSMYCSY